MLLKFVDCNLGQCDDTFGPMPNQFHEVTVTDSWRWFQDGFFVGHPPLSLSMQVLLYCMMKCITNDVEVKTPI